MTESTKPGLTDSNRKNICVTTQMSRWKTTR